MECAPINRVAGVTQRSRGKPVPFSFGGLHFQCQSPHSSKTSCTRPTAVAVNSPAAAPPTSSTAASPGPSSVLRHGLEVCQAKFVAGDVVRCGGFYSTRDDDRVVYRVAFWRRAERLVSRRPRS